MKEAVQKIRVGIRTMDSHNGVACSLVGEAFPFVNVLVTFGGSSNLRQEKRNASHRLMLSTVILSRKVNSRRQISCGPVADSPWLPSGLGD